VIFKMLQKDFLRKKIITAAVYIFIMLSALLLASGTNLIIDLSNSINYLFENSHVPHIVQYHSGDINQDEIDQWSKTNEYIKNQQTAESLNIDESNIYFNGSPEPEDSGVMEMGFVKQNVSFDFLLDLQSRIIKVSKGEIAVPIYYKQQKQLEIGDTLKIRNDGFSRTFTISSFVRDVQMNPSIISSKRFVVSDEDFYNLKDSFDVIEYQIGFQLYDLEKVGEVISSYRAADFPGKGPTIEYSLLKMINALTDGLIAAVIIFISFLLNVVALLCLRFTILATIEEDYKEIGVMKAIGIQQFNIKKIYLSKYVVLGIGAVCSGYVFSLFLNKIFSSNIMLYIGIAPKSAIQSIIPFLAVTMVFWVVLFFCMFTLRRFKKITAVEALRLGNLGEVNRGNHWLPLNKSRFLNVNFFLGLRDVFLRFRLYVILFFVFIISTFIIIVPINFLNTIQSPQFLSYMGMGHCDILIDLRQSDSIIERFDSMINVIEDDSDVEQFAQSITCNFNYINKDGYEESLIVSTGDSSVFPLEYLDGREPVKENELSLSYLISNEMEKDVGDVLELIVDNKVREMQICGIYQDITNGGKTAKALIPPNHDTALWYMVSLTINSDIDEKIKEYSRLFYPAKITNIDGYLEKTFKNTIDQLKLLTILAICISILISILITSLFLKMLIAKDASQIAIMKSIGFSLRDIHQQYITRAFVILNLGIIAGTVFSNTAGQGLISAILSLRGASKIEFVINPLHAYIFSPVVLITVVTTTALLSILSMKDFNISDMNAE